MNKIVDQLHAFGIVSSKLLFPKYKNSVNQDDKEMPCDSRRGCRSLHDGTGVTQMIWRALIIWMIWRTLMIWRSPC